MTKPEPSPPSPYAAPELHRPVAVAHITGAGVEREVAATPEECAAVAARLLIPAVAALSCRFRLSSEPQGRVLAEGTLSARVTRDCVVTLEPFEVDLHEDFRVRFVPEDDFVEPDEDDVLDLESDDEVPYQGAYIDLGEATAEQLALALDPYPRMPGAELPAPDDEIPGSASPFSALARRVRKD